MNKKAIEIRFLKVPLAELRIPVISLHNVFRLHKVPRALLGPEVVTIKTEG